MTTTSFREVSLGFEIRMAKLNLNRIVSRLNSRAFQLGSNAIEMKSFPRKRKNKTSLFTKMGNIANSFYGEVPTVNVEKVMFWFGWLAKYNGVNKKFTLCYRVFVFLFLLANAIKWFVLLFVPTDSIWTVYLGKSLSN